MLTRLKRSYRNKYFLSITLISFFLILLLSFTTLAGSFAMYKKDLEKKAVSVHQERFSSYSNQINMQYNRMVASTDQLVSNRNVLDWIYTEDTNKDLYLTKIVLNRLNYVSAINGAVHSLESYNANSNAIISNRHGYYKDGSENELASSRKTVYREFMSNRHIKQLLISSEEINTVLTPTLIYMQSVPTYHKRGAIGMVIRADMLLPQNIAATENLFIVHKQDPSVYVSSSGASLLADDKLQLWMQTLLEGNRSMHLQEIAIDGKTYYSAYQTILDNQLFLMMLIPESDIVENLSGFSAYFVIALALISVLSVLCSFLIYRVAHQPIRRMVESVNRKMGGPAASKHDPNSSDAIAYLDRTFDSILSKHSQIEKTFDEHKHFFKENALRNLIYGKQDEETAMYDTNSFAQQENNHFLILIFNMDSQHREQDAHVFSHLDSLLFRELERDYEGNWLRTGYRQYTLLVNLRAAGEREALLARIRRFQEEIRGEYDTTMTVGASSLKHEIGEISDCYAEAQEAVKNKTLLGKNRVIDATQLQKKTGQTNSLFIQEVHVLVKKLRTAKEDEIADVLIKLIDEKKDQYSIEMLNAFLLYISYCIAQVGLEYNVSPDVMIDGNLFKVIIEHDSIDEMKEYLIRQCGIVVEVRDSEQKKFKKLSGEVAIKYIEANYHQPISLETVASEIGMSASYLSRVIKQELGINFNMYLNKLRVQEAVKLLSNERLTIKEISNVVGYYNEHTFIRNFKSLMGKTPNHYRNTDLNP